MPVHNNCEPCLVLQAICFRPDACTIALPLMFHTVSSTGPDGLTPTKEMRIQMLNSNQVKTKQNQNLQFEVMAYLLQATSNKAHSPSTVARNVITLIRSSIVEELEQAHLDAKYVIDNGGSNEWVDASSHPEDIWESCIEICSGNPSNGWWVDMLKEFQQEE
jgi:hypothetical protein